MGVVKTYRRYPTGVSVGGSRLLAVRGRAVRGRGAYRRTTHGMSTGGQVAACQTLALVKLALNQDLHCTSVVCSGIKSNVGEKLSLLFAAFP